MVSASAPNTFILIMLAATIVCLVLAACLYVGAIAWRLRMVVRNRHLGPLVETWRDYFTHGIPAGAPVPRVAYQDAFTILNLWNRLHHDDAQPQPPAEWERLETVGRSLGLVRIATNVLKSGDANDRIVALTTVGYLRERDALPAVRALTRRRDGDLSFAAYCALVLIEPAELTTFLGAVARRTDWPVTGIERLLHGLPPEQTSAAFERALESAGPAETIQLLRYFASCGPDEARTAVLAILHAKAEPNVTTAALRALAQRANPGDRPLIRRFIEAGQPVHVRLAALNALLPLCDADDRVLLEGLLEDPNYWIRYRAAQALIRLPRGRSNVSQLSRRLSDRYARDILTQALAESRWDDSRAVISQNVRHRRSPDRHRGHGADAMRTEI